MFKLYWRLVIRPNRSKILLLAGVSFLAAVTEVASIGLIIPVAAVFSKAESPSGQKFLPLLESMARGVGLTPTPSWLLILALAGVGMCIVLKTILTLGGTYLSASLSQETKRTLTLRMFTVFVHARYSELMRRERGEILQDIQGPPDSMGHVAYYSGLSLAAGGQLVLTLAFLLWLSPLLTLIMGAVLLLLVYVNRRYLQRRVAELGQADYPFQQAGSGVLVNVIDGVRVVKVYDLVDRLKGRLDHILAGRMKISVDQLLCQQVPKIVFEFVGIFIVVILIALAQVFPSLGLDFPALAAFVVALRQITPTASTLNVNYLNMNQQWAQARVIEEVLTRMPQEDENHGSLSLPDAIQTLRLESVFFAYEKSPHFQVLCDLSFTCTRGKVTALVGGTGSGKTTITDLILRLQEPSRGRILANATDIRQFSLVEWRRRIGYVGQDAFLFNGTLADNIAALDGGISHSEIVRAAQIAQIHDFIMTLPAGYDTSIGDRGVKLSGGQRQRIAVARAILKRPQVLILDEATSALDTVTERALHEAIEGIRHEAIVLVIAHRLSTVEDADEILVLKDGRVVEHGMHADLLAHQGLYWQLYKATPKSSAAMKEKEV